MKNVTIICAALLVVGMVASASAAEGISKSTLASMGFTSASTLSDLDGMAVRGKGWRGSTSAEVSGKFSASFFDVFTGVSTSTNKYEAESSHLGDDRSSATGNGRSTAGIMVETYGPKGATLSMKYTTLVSGGMTSALGK